MKKGTKKTISTVVATASVLGAIQPAVFAATTNTAAVTASAAVTKVETSISVYDFITAKVLIGKVPAGADKTNLTNRLNKVAPKIFTADYNAALASINQVALKGYSFLYLVSNQSSIDAKIAAVKNPVSKVYLQNSFKAIKNKVFTKDFASALTAVTNAETAKTQAAKDAAQALVSVVANAQNKAFLQARLDKVVVNVDLAVSSVSAINAKQVQVVFNKAVDVTALTKANFTITQDGDASGKDRLSDSASATNNLGTVDTGLVKAGSDAKTVILTVDNTAKFTNGKTITVTVTGVKDGSTTIADVTKTAVLSDTAVPTVVSAVSKASNQFKVNFSEPVFDGNNDNFTTDLKANFTINDGAVAISSAYKDSSDPNAIIVTTAADLTSGTEYSVKVNPSSTTIKDYANYSVMTDTIVKFTHSIESSAPTVTAEAKSESKIRLTFSRPVTIPLNSNIEFRYAYNASGANKVDASTLTGASGVATAVSGSNGTQYDITFTSSPLLAGQGTVYINYTNAADSTKSNVIKDGYGNVVPSGTAVSFTVTSDVTAPTATVAYVDATHFDVTYSEAVLGATTASNYTVKDKNGNIVSVSGAALQDSDKNIYRLTVANVSAGGNYTVAINDSVKDTSVNANKFVPATFTVVVPDTLKPTITAVTQNSTHDKIYVYYSEEMSTTAVDASNYRLTDGTANVQYALPSGTTITQNGSTVTISLPKTLAALQTDFSAANALDKLFIGAVTDKAGNQVANMINNTITAYNANFTASISNVKLLADNKVSFDVNRQLKSVDATKIIKNTAGTQATSATYVNNADGTATVTATFPTSTFGTDLTGTPQIDIQASALTDLNSLVNSAVNAQAITLDYAAPKLSSAVAEDNVSANGKIDTIDATFSEALYASSVSDSDFTVEGYTITGVTVDSVNPKIVHIAVVEKSATDVTATPKVTLTGAVDDVVTITTTQTSRNTLTGSVSVTASSITSQAIASYTPVTLTQTGTVSGSNVQYANAAAVIAALPTTITVTKVDGTTAVIPVTWADTDTYSAATAASYTFTATWGTLPAGVNNSGSVAAPTVEVVVAP